MDNLNTYQLLELALAVTTLLVLAAIGLRGRGRSADRSDPVETRLYRNDNDGLRFWDVHTRPDGDYLIRWGLVGKASDKTILRAVRRQKLLKTARDCRDDGYAEFAPEDHFCLALQYEARSMPEPELRQKQHRLERVLSDILDAHGLGKVTGGYTDGTSMEVLALVVDAIIARHLVTDALLRTEFGDYRNLALYEPQSVAEEKASQRRAARAGLSPQ